MSQLCTACCLCRPHALLVSICRLQVSCVTRLVHQKGIHLIKHAAWRTLERGGQFVLLGSAPDPRVQVRQEPDKPALAALYFARTAVSLPFGFSALPWNWSRSGCFVPNNYLLC